MEKLYTFILDYKGGTYISQVKNELLNDAIIDWIKICNFMEITGKRVNKNKLIDKMMKSDDEPVLLTNLVNVWCISLIVCNNLALVNIVQTEEV